MSAAPFTPGPWHYLDMGEIVPSDSDGFPDPDTRICFMATPGSAINAHERIEANANLIAAAPDLYKALEAARREIVFQLRGNEALAKMNANVHGIDTALAKARGDA